ncbi:predicted protein [Plenodomus lingam JN3]|uniref:Predicted protein n=1 Tax=Leptosphaeria maculans (strain JN3 / isolate v23.1.3 / race Av1-4-5-6-7-8) TaxID=985895 RepID=E4ZY49_LEPMJ|nr:predicted protein [Plenodomus lingam JN3]CBX96294.1 predicted protein [Plenodomus lingam JN3]
MLDPHPIGASTLPAYAHHKAASTAASTAPIAAPVAAAAAAATATATATVTVYSMYYHLATTPTRITYTSIYHATLCECGNTRNNHAQRGDAGLGYWHTFSVPATPSDQALISPGARHRRRTMATIPQQPQETITW